MTAVQERRLRERRSRLIVRAFDHRQRRHVRLSAELLSAENLALVPFPA